ncbi:vascular endothelial growth factor receptor 2-like isoform X1 [Myxocyprinus asiaticus]|uniref:vascular endothelial growth factor receptor 2-like isoform X1 n=1 Tax=Myxocyprinus asiaticus TaxID=70543 RepID=UPI0022237067|nr:vascular endothelial growth factor receptor 2-like isoform X1 [Myxocyprinus asiaticus]
MAKTFNVHSLVEFLFIINLAIAIELRFVPDPPTLNITEKILKINASDTLEITCRGRQILDWSLPYNRTHFETRLTISDCSGEGLFCSTLTLTRAVANETGEYRCFYKNLHIEDGKTSKAVYVFVQDYHTPFVRMTQVYDVVFIREREQVVIPCLVSVEDLNVTLYTKYPVKELATDGKEVIWDSKRGFILPSHVVSYAGVVYCETIIQNETYQSSTYIVTVVGYKIYDLTLSPAYERLTVGERLVLNCTAHTELNVGIDFQWTFPHEKRSVNSSTPRSRYDIKSNKKKLWNSLELSNSLIVQNVTINDTGEYICTASSGQMQKTAHASLIVYEKPFIALNDQLLQTVEATVGQEEAKILVKYYAYPEPSVKWYKNNQPISWKDEYRMKPARGSLTIYGVTEKDAGNYTVIMTNKVTKEEQRRTFQLLVNDRPRILEKEVPLDRDVHMYGSSPTLRCTASSGSSPVTIQWQWMPREDCPIRFQPKSDQNVVKCDKWREILNNTGKNPISSPISVIERSLKTISILKIQKAVDHALYRCIATNKMGTDERIIVFQVTRFLNLSVLPSSSPIEGEDVVMRCVADRLLYSNLRWYRVTNIANPNALPVAVPCDSLTLSPFHQPNVTILGLQGTNATLDLPIPNTTLMDQGLYACQVENVGTSERTCLLHNLRLQALEMARIVTNLTDQRVNVSDSTMLVCEVSGTPTPTVFWTKDNQTVVEGSGVILKQSNRILTIQRVKKEDSGLYICTACNHLGCDSDEALLTVDGAEEKMNVELIMPIGAVVIGMFLWLLIVFVIRNRKRPNDVELKTGYLSIILDSDDMPMDEHCERLTYDASKWEFPRDRLKLGEPLGRGAFGQVVEATAYGIEKASTCTTVAVKMLKEGATSSEYRALMSELKILIHIGHHLNVVNLLGACTKPGGPLMVIVEYCKHGNLSSYLKSKRGEYSPYKRHTSRPCRREVQQLEDLCEGDLGLGASTRLDICTGTAVCTRLGEQTTTTHVQDEQESSDWDQLTMEDLISYSFQVAKGMEFLASRKCIHRDLAARNILLSENNVVKICDFGLARDVYKDPDYVRKGDARLPLKWMAPETIFDRVYTTQSDVWSFGVLLWEIFSLGASPYPGVCIDESFCRRLKEGTRMRAPDYATPEIYQTMLDCWLDRPKDRPTFTQLVEHLGNLLQASAQQDGKDYIPLTNRDMEEESGTSNRTPYIGSTEANFQYDKAPPLGFPQQIDSCVMPIRMTTFEDIPLEQSAVMNGHMDCGVGLSREQMKALDRHVQRTPIFSPLLRCKSKESLASESSNQTSGYQSGYHSDDAEVPIYANEEIILKRDIRKKPPLPKRDDKFTADVRYSAPPV